MKKNYMCYLLTSETKYFSSGKFSFSREVVHLELRMQLDLEVVKKSRMA